MRGTRLRLRQILLYEARAQMNIDLDERRVADALEAMDLPGLDDENVARARLEFLAVHHPETAALPHELHLIVRVAMGPGAPAGEGTEQEDGDVHVAIV